MKFNKYTQAIRPPLESEKPYSKNLQNICFWLVLFCKDDYNNKDKNKKERHLNSMIEQKKPISYLIQLIKKHIEFLNKFNEDILKKHSLFAYPIKPLIAFYQKQLIDRLAKREKKANNFSDILVWYAHKMIGFIYKIETFISGLDQKIKKQVTVSMGNSQPNMQKAHSFSYITNEPSSSQSGPYSMNQILINDKMELDNLVGSYLNVNILENILKVPALFLSQSIPNVLKSMAARMREQSIYKKQKENILHFLSVYEKSIQQFCSIQAQKSQDNQKQEEQIEQKVKGKFYENIPNPKSRIAVKFGNRFLFIAKLRLRVIKANKHINERKIRIKELIDGENKYIQGLKDYIQYIKKPIQATNLASKQELYKMFSTIEPILVLHTDFHATLKKHYENYSKYQTYGDILMKKFPYFQIYIEYILYADEAQALLLKLSQEHEQIQEICSKFMKEKQKKASDELKQPTFRIARYELILKQIIKNTNSIHPDYKKLLEAQKDGVNMLRKINETVDRTCRRNRMNQLEQEYGTLDRPVFVEGRDFLEQFQLFYVHDEKLESVSVFVFNDILVVVQNQYRKIIKWIKIDENFYVRREEDNKIYRNIIKIHSEGFITFSAGSEDKNYNKAETFFNLLQRVSKENQQNNKMVYVQVIGTQEIGSTSFAKHTQYVIEIKYLGLRKFVHLRFSEMQPFVAKIQNFYGNDLNISKQEALKKNWFNNHKSKTIEDRKRTIEQILQKMLNHELVKKDPQYILQQLKIDSNFFKMTEQLKRKRLTLGKIPSNEQQKNGDKDQLKNGNKSAQNSPERLVTSSLMRSKKKQSKQAETILCATQIKLGRDLYHDPDDTFLDGKKTQAQKIQIEIHTMVEEEPISVSITELHTVQDVCHRVSKLIGLRMNRDFRLFHQIGKKQLRVLDQQQKLMKIFNFPKKQVKIGLISQVLDSVKKIIAPETHPKLIFKKYYFLPIQIEQSECRKDLTRLRLLVYQIFSQIKEMKYQLSFDEYLLFLAMLIYIQFDGEVPQKLQNTYVYRLIPETIFKLKNYTEQQWLQKCRPHIMRLKEEIDKIIQYNRQQLKTKKIKADSISKTALHFGHRHLCSQIVINKIKSNTIYGSNLFYVQPYRDTYEKLLDEGRKMAYNMWLAIKVEGLNLLTPSSKETVLQLKYKDIEKIFVYSQAIIFKMQGLSTCQYRFNTYQSFEISQLVKYNKCLNDTLQQLQRDEDLIARARMYKQDSLIYRNTYDKNERQINQGVQV